MKDNFEYRTEYIEDKASAMVWKRWLEWGVGVEPDITFKGITYHGDKVVCIVSFPYSDLERKINRFQMDGALVTCNTSGFDYIVHPSITIKHGKAVKA